LLFPYNQHRYIYRKPWDVLSFANFEKYYEPAQSKLNMEQFPLLKKAAGFDLVLEHGDTLFMPAGYWHHMEYLESGFAMSLRALQQSLEGKLHGAWNLFGMRNIDTLMKKTVPDWWYEYKRKKIADFSD
jgi:ribosomal protein L16 Arg81 hydroxylase